MSRSTLLNGMQRHEDSVRQRGLNFFSLIQSNPRLFSLSVATMAGIDVAEADFATNLLQKSTALDTSASLIVSPISIAIALSTVGTRRTNRKSNVI